MAISVERRPARLTRLGIAVAVLAACEGVPTTVHNTPTLFLAEYDDGGLDGLYDPTGFTPSEVRTGLASACSGAALSAYNERREDHLIGLKAHCRGSLARGFVVLNAEKREATISVLVNTYDDNGSLQTRDLRYPAEVAASR